jgi:hypothetical protein
MSCTIARSAFTLLAQAAGIERSRVAELARAAEKTGSESGFLNTENHHASNENPPTVALAFLNPQPVDPFFLRQDQINGIGLFRQ